MNAPLASCIIVSTEISEPLTKISEKEKNEIKKKKEKKRKVEILYELEKRKLGIKR